MTCIAGWIDGKGTVWVGGDSAQSYGQTQVTGTNQKVFERKGKGATWLFGYSGTLRASQIVKYLVELPDASKCKDGDVVGFVVRHMVPALREALGKNGASKKKDGTDGMDGCLMVGVLGKLMVIDSALFVRHAKGNFDAIGSGGDTAFGSLFTSSALQAGDKAMDPETRLTLALEAAEANTSNVKRPFHFISAKPHRG